MHNRRFRIARDTSHGHPRPHITDASRAAQDRRRPARLGVPCVAGRGPDAGRPRRCLSPPRPGREQRRSCSWSRPTRDVEQLTRDARFFLAALEGLSDAERRARGAAVSVARSRSVPRPRAALRRRVGARARAARARATGTARLVIASAAALLPRLSAPARLHGRASIAEPGHEISPIDLGDRLADAGFTRAGSGRRARRVLRARRRRRLLSRRREAADPRSSSSATRSSRSATYDPATQRSIGAIDQARDRSAAGCCSIDDGSAGSFGDVLRLRRCARRRACVIVRAGRSRRAGDEADASRSRTATTRRSSEGTERSAARELVRRAGSDVGAVARRRDRARDARARGSSPRPRHIALVSRRMEFARPHCRTGSRRSAQRASAATRSLFVADSPAAPSASIELLADYEVPARRSSAARTRGRAAVLVAHRASVERLPSA